VNHPDFSKELIAYGKRLSLEMNLPLQVVNIQPSANGYCARGHEIELFYQQCKEAGADYVGGMELVQKIQGENWFDFDVVIASPDMMGVVGRLGKVLGPKGLMPSPKAGTVTPNLAQAIKESKAGKIEYRLDKTNIIHCPIGKASFGAEKLLENYTALITAILRAKPATAKGQYIRSCVTATTMGPGIKINAQKQL